MFVLECPCACSVGLDRWFGGSNALFLKKLWPAYRLELDGKLVLRVRKRTLVAL